MSRKKQKTARQKTGGGVMRTIVMLIAICVFLYSAYQLYLIFIEYKKGSDEYKKIAGEFMTIDPLDIDFEEELVCPIDFDALLAKNEDTVGWIQFREPSVINYPIMQAEDNDYYLKRTFERKVNSSGSIFMDCDNNKEFTDENTFIYGHNMKNGSMFGKLRKYREKEFWEENPYFYIYTPDKRVRKYQIFSCYVVDAEADSYIKFYDTEEMYEEYLAMITGRSIYDTEVEVSPADQIVSLSTCTSRADDERFLVHAKLIKQS